MKPNITQRQSQPRPQQMKQQKQRSVITDWAATQKADLTTISTTLDGVVAGIAVLDALIAGFQNSPGSLSAEDQSALDDIQTFSKALLAKAAAISTTPPVPVTPIPPTPPGEPLSVPLP